MVTLPLSESFLKTTQHSRRFATQKLTPLHVAASRGQSEIAQLLLDFGANVHGPSDDGDWTPLVFAAYRGHFDVAAVLIENGAGVTELDGNPIHYSGQRKHKQICRMLVEHGAIDGLIDSDDPDVLDLFRAAYSYDVDSVRAVLSGGQILLITKTSLAALRFMKLVHTAILKRFVSYFDMVPT